MKKQEWNERVELIEKALVEHLGEKTALSSTLCDSMKYSLTAGGKRLRPRCSRCKRLGLHACSLCNGNDSYLFSYS